VLSGNSADHLVISLAAMTAGIPVAPVSAAYSLQSRDHARIREIAALGDAPCLNQRRVLAAGADLVERLYADPPGPEVVVRLPQSPGYA
jgi:acyl-CoA synthetase (AMP-forming)/AMP-acid ligase II